MPTKVSAVLVIDMPTGNTELCQVMASAWHIHMIYTDFLYSWKWMIECSLSNKSFI